MSRVFVESLEPRRLFAGVTLLATGRLGGTTGWMQTMADAITAQLGGPSQVPQFVLSINANPTTGALVPTIAQVSGTGTPQTSSSGEIIVLIDYYNISTNVSYPSPVIGSVIANYLMNTPVDGIDLASLPIHEIGVSRGAGIIDGITQALGQAGVWVDQETYLDPDPLAAQGDPPSTIYDNVEFVDNYWRNDGSVSQQDDGNPVNGAYNLNVYWLDSDDAGYSTPHLAPAGYYIGTIDQTATESGEGPIYSNWYGNTPSMPARDATGWIYSEIVGAARPLSGVWAASGGTGARTAAGQVGTQWGNASDLTITSGNTISTGNSIQASYLHEDRGSADTITFYLDTDRNPYNNTFADTLGSVNLPETGIITKASATLSTAGVAPGTYWLCAKITDAAGNTRYTYESITAPLTVTSSPVAILASPATISAATSHAETLTVTYAGAAPINPASLSSSNLQVSGPGFTGLATYVGVDGNVGSDTRVVTYSIPAPAGGWATSDNGTYAVSVQPNQVRDTSGRYVAAGSIGSFTVVIVNGSLTGSQGTAASSYNLTTLGTSDWAHWGTGNVASNFDHNATGNSQISNVTELGSGSYGAWSDPSRDVSWTDGSPLTSDSGDDSYIWASNALGAGYSFTVPASTTAQTLYVYAGGYSSGATLTAHLSDGSSADYVATVSGSGIYTTLFTITFNAASAGQTLTISYVKSSNVNGTSGSVDLIAAALAAGSVADTSPPTASLTSAPSITAASSAAYTFTVTYSDNVAVNAATIGNNNLLVTGSGYSQAATLVSTGLTNGSTVVATYSIPAPTGGWAVASNGTYTIALLANQVADISANYALPVASLGTFTVNIPVAAGTGALVGSQATAAASYNLTTLGTSDWAHWGTGDVYGAFDHKASGGSQISNVTVLGSGSEGSYFDPSRSVSWTDGSPLATDAGDDGYIWANNALGAGYSFTVPAGTTTQTLYVYVGGYSSGATLTAHLSDGSAADYVVTSSGTGLYTNLYTITFKAASAGQTLTISYVKSSNVNGTSGSVDLIAAALAGAPVADTTPPTAKVTSAPALTAATSAAYQFTVTYSDNVAVNAATVGNNNLLVTGTGYSQKATLVSTGLTNGSTVVAIYSIAAPTGGWAVASNGTYTIALQANQVADTSANYALPVVSLGTFTVNIPAVAGTGSLAGSQATAASSYNLTTLGTSDWAHWGTGNVASNFDHKATGNSQISNVTELGSGSYGSWSDPSRDVSWTDGSPLATDSGDDSYIWANNALGAGYSFTVPASTTTETLYIYAGGYSSGATLTAHLSDGSAADYVVTTSGTGLYTNLYAITFKAASAGQTLTISYVKSSNVNGTSGSVDLIAAALVG